MSVDKLVQVGSTLWLEPADVKYVRWIESSEPVINKHTGETMLKGYPGYTQIAHESPGIMGTHVGFLSSDWPVERVRLALGLKDATEFYETLERA